MDLWLRDLWAAAKTLRHGRRVTLLVVLILALGIGAATAIFSVLKVVVLEPLPYREPQALMALGERDHRTPRADLQVSAHTYLDWREQNRSFSHLEAYCPRAFDVLGGAFPERVNGAVVTPELFSALGVEAALGRVFDATTDGAVVVVSDRFWQRFHGRDPALVGQTLELSGEVYRVLGVMPAGFQSLPEGAELWIRASEPVPAPGGFLSSLASLEEAGAGREMRYLSVIGRLRTGVDPVRATADMEAVTARLRQAFPAIYENWTVEVVTLRELLLGAVSRPLWVLFGAVSWVLLIACANVAALQAARAAERQREMSIRSALGASRGHLIRQLLAESLLVSLSSGALGLFATYWLVSGLTAWMPEQLPRLAEARVDLGVAMFTLGISLSVGLILGLLPACTGWRIDLRQTLIAGGPPPRRSRLGARGLLVSCQVGAALVLLVGAGLLLRSHLTLSELDLGIETEGLLVLRMTLDDLQAASDPSYDQLAVRIAALPKVRSVARSATVPLAGGEASVPFVAETDRSEPILVGWRVVGPGYFQTLGIPIEAGREFDGREEPTSPFSAVVSRSAAERFWPGEDAIGKRISLDMPGGEPWWSEVIGVVGEVRYRGLRQPAGPEVYYALSQNPQLAATYLVRTHGEPMPVAPDLRRLAAEVLPGRPVASLQSMVQLHRGQAAELRSYALLLAAFGLAAVVLVAFGLYGLLAQAIALSWREMGVRAALGASRRRLSGLVLGRALGWVVVGLGGGLIVALGLRGVLSSLLFQVESHDSITWVGCILLFGVVTLLASYPAARKLARVDPAVVLRGE